MESVLGFNEYHEDVLNLFELNKFGTESEVAIMNSNLLYLYREAVLYR